MKRLLPAIVLLISSIMIIYCGQKKEEHKSIEDIENSRLGIVDSMGEYVAADGFDAKAMLATFAEFELNTDLSHLSDNEKKILSILFDVADIMEELYWKQAIGIKDSFLMKINDENLKQFAKIHYGPWNRLDGNKPYIKGIGEKPKGANFYPVDMSKEEFDAIDDENKNSLYTVIRRCPNNDSLYVFWYHEVYATQLQKAADLLKEAATLAEDSALANYFNLRAEALITDDYQPSDFAWMKVKDANIDFVVGAIENYEDALYGKKAAFESFILVKDNDWSKKLQKFNAMLPDLQKSLPVADEYKTEMPGTKADMNVYDAIYYAGDCNAGSKTIAINLPNDEEVHMKIGSRKLQLKNSMKAKFDKILVPIAEMMIAPEQQKHVTFNAFFENTMFHEVGHGMGVKNTITDKGSAREALAEYYSSIEEGKADIMGLYLVTKLYEMGELTEGEVMDNYVTFMAGIFRSSRFGTASSHGKANMMRFAYFQEQGAFTKNEEGYYVVDFEKMKAAMNSLLNKIIVIQGNGDYEAAKEWVIAKGEISPELKADIDKINAGGIPVDIVFKKGKDVVGLN